MTNIAATTLKQVGYNSSLLWCSELKPHTENALTDKLTA